MKIKYLNESSYIKKETYLKENYQDIYKSLINNIYPSLINNSIKGKKIKDKYELIIPTSKIFQKIHGNIKLIYQINKNNIIIEDIKPNNLFKDNKYILNLTEKKDINNTISKDNISLDIDKIPKYQNNIKENITIKPKYNFIRNYFSIFFILILIITVILINKI